MSQSYHPIKSLAEFHKAFGEDPWYTLDEADRTKSLIRRLTLIREEFEEVEQELLESINPGGTGNYTNLAKELADLLYVIYGTAETLCIPIEQVFEVVHASNMSKLGRDGKPVLRADGKFLKGPDYRPADLTRILAGGRVALR